jgi:hypothetical protein
MSDGRIGECGECTNRLPRGPAVWQIGNVAFCSDDCYRKGMDHPERYFPVPVGLPQRITLVLDPASIWRCKRIIGIPVGQRTVSEQLVIDNQMRMILDGFSWPTAHMHSEASPS